MKVIIIGSNGFLGKNLTKCLKDEGIDVVEISSQNGLGIDPSTGLLPDNFEITNSSDGIVVYLSQSPRTNQVPNEAPHVIAVNSLSPVKVGIAAIKANIKRFIYVSTGTVYKPSFEPLSEESPVQRENWYALSKLHGEESLNLLRSYLEVVVLRPFTLYGPGQVGRLIPNLIESIKNSYPVTIRPREFNDTLDGGLKLSLCHIDDAVAMIRHVIDNGGPRIMNISSPEALSIRDIASAIGYSIGINPLFEIAEQIRDGNLIANTEVLQNVIKCKCVSFNEGIQTVIKYQRHLNKLIIT